MHPPNQKDNIMRISKHSVLHTATCSLQAFVGVAVVECPVQWAYFNMQSGKGASNDPYIQGHRHTVVKTLCGDSCLRPLPFCQNTDAYTCFSSSNLVQLLSGGLVGEVADCVFGWQARAQDECLVRWFVAWDPQPLSLYPWHWLSCWSMIGSCIPGCRCVMQLQHWRISDTITST